LTIIHGSGIIVETNQRTENGVYRPGNEAAIKVELYSLLWAGAFIVLDSYN